MSEPESKVVAEAAPVVEPEADHVSYTLDMSLEQIERLEREKAALMREQVRSPLPPRIEVTPEQGFEGKMTTPALAAQPPIIGGSSGLVMPVLEGVARATSGPQTAQAEAEKGGRLVIPDRTAEAQAARTNDMPQASELVIPGGKPSAQCSNRCDVRNGGSAFYHCHNCQRQWRNGEVVAVGPQRMVVAG